MLQTLIKRLARELMKPPCNWCRRRVWIAFFRGKRLMLTPMAGIRSEKHIPEHSSVVEQLAYIQRVGGPIPSVPIA